MLSFFKKSIKSCAFFFWKKLFSRHKQDYVFIMAHPRSGSSLLMQILTNNKDIIGFGEYFINYKSMRSLKWFEFDIRRKTNSFFKGKKYVANQINDNSLTKSFNLASYSNLKYLFLIRTPQESLSSLLKLSEKKLGYSDQKNALKIYTERLNYFYNEIPKISSENRFFLTYHELTKNTDSTLKKITQFLELDTNLSSNYKVEKYTQIWGDPSENIVKGEIVNTNAVQVTLDKEILLQAEKEYHKLIELLSKEHAS